MSSRSHDSDETVKKIALGVSAVMGALGLAAGAAFLIDRAVDDSQQQRHNRNAEPTHAAGGHAASAQHRQQPQRPHPAPEHQSRRSPLTTQHWTTSVVEAENLDDDDGEEEEEEEEDDIDGSTEGEKASNTAVVFKSVRQKRVANKKRTLATVSGNEGPSAGKEKNATSARVRRGAALADCAHFLAGRCQYGDGCGFRHSEDVSTTTPNCRYWPDCNHVQCRFQHPKALTSTKAAATVAATPPSHPPKLRAQAQPPAVRSIPSTPPAIVAPAAASVTPSSLAERHVHYFWDVENCPVPKGASAFAVVNAVRRLVGEAERLRERSFKCYCDPTSLSKTHRTDLSHANVQLVDVPIRKPGAADRSLHLDLDRLQMNQGYALTVVLISGDADFIHKLNDLRYQHACTVVLIHNAAAHKNLKATAHRSYEWTAAALHDTSSGAEGRTQSAPRPDKAEKKKAEKVEEKAKAPSATAVNSRAVEDEAEKLQCPQCPMKAQSEGALHQHQAAKGHWWGCPGEGCQRVFETLQGLRAHQADKMHNPPKSKGRGKEKEWKKGKDKDQGSTVCRCYDCGQEFTTEAALYQHREAKH